MNLLKIYLTLVILLIKYRKCFKQNIVETRDDKLKPTAVSLPNRIGRSVGRSVDRNFLVFNFLLQPPVSRVSSSPLHIATRTGIVIQMGNWREPKKELKKERGENFTCAITFLLFFRGNLMGKRPTHNY